MDGVACGDADFSVAGLPLRAAPAGLRQQGGRFAPLLLLAWLKPCPDTKAGVCATEYKRLRDGAKCLLVEKAALRRWHGA